MRTDRSWTEIELRNFTHNLNELKKFIAPKAGFIQIVKADAYGHGAYQIAKKAIESGAEMLGVANVQEGQLLRFQGITKPILVLSPLLKNEIPFLQKYDLIPTVSTYEFAENLNTVGKFDIHINIDTGMGRSGFVYQEAKAKIERIKKLSNLNIVGIFSHFSSAEDDLDYTKRQNELFKEILTNLDIQPKYIHIANSSALLSDFDDISNLVRLGLLSFGIYSHPDQKKKIDLKPVMTFYSKISQLKTAEENEAIGYNRTFITKRKTRYAILPVGYADGYDFLLSNRGEVLCNGIFCPVIGKVSMDMIAIDVSDLSSVHVNDEVTLLGSYQEKLRVENLTALYHGSSYELLCQIGRRAKRYYLENGKLVSSSPLLRRNFMPTDYSENELGEVISTAIEQRLQSKEIAELISSELLQRFFSEKDRNIQYRSQFDHTIEFLNSDQFPDHFLAKTKLSFQKKLQNDHFYVACAKDEKNLEKYFLRNDVEYRWLLDDNFDLKEQYFNVTSVKINDIELYHEMRIADGCIEIKCHHPALDEMVEKEVHYTISTQTYYPKNSHQLSVFIIDLTQEVKINFLFHEKLQKVEVIPIFAGKHKFPVIKKQRNKISVKTKPNEWVFPTSGVVFVY